LLASTLVCNYNTVYGNKKMLRRDNDHFTGGGTSFGQASIAVGAAGDMKTVPSASTLNIEQEQPISVLETAAQPAGDIGSTVSSSSFVDTGASTTDTDEGDHGDGGEEGDQPSDGMEDGDDGMEDGDDQSEQSLKEGAGVSASSNDTSLEQEGFSFKFKKPSLNNYRIPSRHEAVCMFRWLRTRWQVYKSGQLS